MLQPALARISNRSPEGGFTLIELVIIIVIGGILVTVALNTGSRVNDQARVEEARQEMEALRFAIVGNPSIENLGSRTDFGYVGDIGALPPDLEALRTNPGWSTWKGPYIASSYAQDPDDFKIDPWGYPYTYSGVTITSTGSGSSLVQGLALSPAHLSSNTISGTVTDLQGTPPGSAFKDSLLVQLTLPDGSGSIVTRNTSPDAGGYFEFGDVPVGVHDVRLIFLPTSDTIARFVTVNPNSTAYSSYRLDSARWSGISTGGGLVLISNSDSLAEDCHGFHFHVENTSAIDVTLISATLTWSGIVAYYRYIRIDDVVVFDKVNAKAGSGEEAVFMSPITIAGGESVRIDFDFFKSNPTGGADVAVNDLDFSIAFSNGSTFDISPGACP